MKNPKNSDLTVGLTGWIALSSGLIYSLGNRIAQVKGWVWVFYDWILGPFSSYIGRDS